MALVDIGITVRSSGQDNLWYGRLLASFAEHAPGIAYGLHVIEGEHLSRVEKRCRLLRASQAPYLVIMEDDAQVLHPGWLVGLADAAADHPDCALVSPQETREDYVLANAFHEGFAEASLAPGFCFLLNRAADLSWDVRIQAFDDLYLSLLARSRGWRIGRTGRTVVRHTKQPWLRDDLPPWEQGDTSRFGAGDAYYERERHKAQRAAEGRFLLRRFGPLAEQGLPPEVLDDIRQGRFSPEPWERA